MTLYNPAGDAFELTASEWLNLLAHATCNGWQPGKPQPAAILFDLDCPTNGHDSPADIASSFETPIAQIMSAKDAYGLASILRSNTPPAGISGTWLSHFCSFCEGGRSLLLSGSASPSALPKPSPSPISITSQLLNLSNSLSSGQGVVVQSHPLSTKTEEELYPVQRT